MWLTSFRQISNNSINMSDSGSGRYSMRKSTRQRSVDSETRRSTAASRLAAGALVGREASPETRTGIAVRGAPPTSRSTAYGGRDVLPPEGLSSHVTRAPPARLLGAAIATSHERSGDAPLRAVIEEEEQAGTSTADTDESPLGDEDNDETDAETATVKAATPPRSPRRVRVPGFFASLGARIASFWKVACVVLFSAFFLSAVQQTYVPSLSVPAVDLSRVTDFLGLVSPSNPAAVNISAGMPIYQGVSSWRFDRLTSRVSNLETSLASLSKSVSQKSALRRMNFFAAGSGVMIDPYLTSPTRRMKWSGAAARAAPRSYMDIIRGRPSSLLPRSGPGPASVLHSWDDAGECWCSPQGGGRSQVAMVLPNAVIPQELVVEHIPESATLDPQAMPQDLEFWVQVEDPTARQRVTDAALDAVETDDSLFGSHASSAADDYSARKALDETWVRVGRWTFRKDAPEPAQAFQVPVRLDELAIPVARVVVRTTSSWGRGNNVCIYRLKLHGMVANELPHRTA